MIKKPVFVLLLVIGLWSAFALPAPAQTPTPNEIDEISRDLWCPLCNGVRLDNCELQACIQMKEVIAQKLEAGESREQIKAYFVAQYGDVVLGAPSTRGFNSLAWILPVLATAVGLGWLVYFVRSLTRKRLAADSARPTPSVSTADQAAQDEYLRRVDDELNENP